MFAGIVTAVGRIASSQPSGDGVRLRIEAPGLGMDDVALGDSIAVHGVRARHSPSRTASRRGVK